MQSRHHDASSQSTDTPSSRRVSAQARSKQNSQSNVTIWYDPFLFQVTPLEFVGTVTIVYIVSMRHFVFKLYRALSTRAPPMGNYATLAILHSECTHAVNVRVGLSSAPDFV